MGYLHIPNLYKSQEILMFKRCYALEKIHGTSAHVGWDGRAVTYFSGGERIENFKALFDDFDLTRRFVRMFESSSVIVFGEAYGGKCQGMSKTYGPNLKFVAFDVKVGESWLAVPNAEEVARGLGLDFVHWLEISATIECIDAARDLESAQALKNAMGGGLMREGVVLRPLIECRMDNSDRIIAKHKRPEFSERKTIPNVDPAKREIASKASEIADEWVTPNRMAHVVDHYRANLDDGVEVGERDTGAIVKAMIEDVCREGAGEIQLGDGHAVRKAIGGKAAQLFKAWLVAH